MYNVTINNKINIYPRESVVDGHEITGLYVCWIAWRTIMYHEFVERTNL